MNKYIDKENECSKSVMKIQTKPAKLGPSMYLFIQFKHDSYMIIQFFVP